MARIAMEAKGRFGQLFAAALKKKGISLRTLAAKVEYTYENMRKVYLGLTAPSDLLLKDFIRILDLDPKAAKEAVTADRMERAYGKSAYNVLGKDPRLGDIEELLPQLSQVEWDMFVSQMRGFVQQRRSAR